MLAHENISRLSRLYSYISRESFAVSEMQDLIPTTTAGLLGVYVNDPSSIILITSGGLHLMQDGDWKVIEYSQMRGVYSGITAGGAAVEISLASGGTVVVPVTNQTEGESDVFEFCDYLFSVIFHPHNSRNSESLKDVEDATMLAQFLEEQEVDDGMKYHDMRRALISGFPSRWQLDSLGISPDLLDNPSVWKLLGLFYMIGKES